MKRTISSKTLIIIIVLTVLFAALFVSYMIIVDRPIAKVEKEYEERREKASLDLTVFTIKKARLDEMQAEIDKMTKEYGTITVPSFDNLQQLMLFLNSVMEETEEFSFSFSPFQVSDDMDSVIRRKVSMSFTCVNYAAARKLIESLQNCPYFCLVESISMTKSTLNSLKESGDSITDGTVKVSLSATFFERVEAQK